MLIRSLITVFFCFSTMGMIIISANDSCDFCEDSDTTGAILNDADFAQLPVNNAVMYDRAYRQVIGSLAIYDMPHGNHIRTLDEGFNFVTVSEESDGWSRINHGEWVQTGNLAVINPVSSFTGFTMENGVNGLEGVLAWALVNMYPSREAGSVPDETQEIIYRYTPLVITDYELVDGIRWYQIGVDRWVHQHRVAKVQPLEEIPDGVDSEIWIGIDIYEQVLIAYEGLTPVFTSLVATGLPRWPTYEGTFNIYYRIPRKDMSWGVVGDDFYFLEEVPWTMFFDDGRALHGAYWHDGLGYRRSHGCVNMSLTDAKWLYDWVSAYMGSSASSDIEAGPNVHVYSSGEYH